MKWNKLFIFVFLLILIVPAIMAWTPTSNINGRDFYTVYNFTNISAGTFYQNGSLLLSNETTLNVNSSIFWGLLDSIDEWFKEVGTDLSMNTTHLNLTINAINDIYNDSITTYIDAQDVTFNTSITTYVDARDVIINTSATTYADNQFIAQSEESNLNVNQSTFWGFLDDIGSFFLRAGTFLGLNTTYFNDTYDARYIQTANEGDLNVNSSDFWDNLTSPTDITQVGTLNNLTVTNNASVDILNAATNVFINGIESATINDLISGNLTITSIVVIRNDDASTVYAGTPMYFSGYLSGINVQTAVKANNTAIDGHSDCLVLGTIASNNTGQCVVQGQVTEMNTSSLLVGDELYLNETPGTLINYKPNVTCIQKVGMVLRNHTNLGVVWVHGAGRCNDAPNVIDITGNVTANWLFAKLNWSYIQNKFIEAVDTAWIYMSGTTLTFNSTKLDSEYANKTFMANADTVINTSATTYADNEFISNSEESNLNVNSSGFWDNLDSPTNITQVGTLVDLTVTNSIVADWFNGSISWANIQNKFITAVGKFFFMDGTTLTMNTTELNTTIDSRVSISGNFSAGLGIKLVGTNYSVEAGSGLTQEVSGLKVEDNGINDTHLTFDTGQALTTADWPTFDNVTITTELNPLTNLTFGKGTIVLHGQRACFLNSTGVCGIEMYINGSNVFIIG